MTGGDLIVLVPWLVFVAALAVIGLGPVPFPASAPMTVPLWAWAATLAAFAALIAADLLLTRDAGGGLRAAAVASGAWIAVALAFGVVMWLWRGPDAGRGVLRRRSAGEDPQH